MANSLTRVINSIGGQPRDGQIRMHHAVRDAIRTNKHLLVEAPTGVGKSLAYLTAVADSGARTIIATSTLALQDQLATKDLPTVEKQIPNLSWAVAKGRNNYLCVVRADETYDNEISNRGLFADETSTHIETVRSWQKTTSTGDRAEISVDDRTWAKFSVTSQECPGASKCGRSDECFAEQARSAARDAQIVITNTAMLFAHLQSGERILGERDLIIIDEAHDLVDIASNAYGVDITSARATRIGHQLRKLLTDPGSTVESLDRAAEKLDHVLSSFAGETVDPTRGELAETLTAITDTCTRLAEELNEMTLAGQDGDTLASIIAAVTSLASDTNQATTKRDTDTAWVESMHRTNRLKVATTDPATHLARDLFTGHTVICCSATLGVAGSLQWTADRFGLTTGTETTPDHTDVTLETSRITHPYWEHLDTNQLSFDALIVESPFDYDTQALLYCATDLPAPNDSRYPAAARTRTEELINITGGRALVLCTSTNAGKAMADYLRDRLDVQVLDQWSTGRAHAIREFTNDETSVLVATMGFWQGVDVPGRACSLVILDRIPFGRRDDPLTQARRQLAERAGQNAFMTVDVPKAATMLAQGVGRLIRTTTDHGVVAVLDPRLATAKSYRWQLIKSLPPMRRTGKLNEVNDFFNELTPT